MFSIIITTHNSEKYITETLRNIIGASKNIKNEIILVDDGSTDNTRNIIKKINNLKIIYQDNKGVSAARNKALSYISNESQLITFIDDSDKVSTDFFENNIRFFEKYKYINIAFSPIINVQNNHFKNNSLNNCFEAKKDIIDIFKDYNYIRFHIGGAVFRSSILKVMKKTFDQDIHFWEDAKLINKLIIKYKYYGLVRNANYFYNLDDNNSLTKSSWSKPERYTSHIKNNYLYLINLSIDYYGVVINYIQYLLLIHYSQYLLSHNLEKIDLVSINNPDFIRMSKELFKHIDKNIINNSNLDKRYCLFLYNMKGISTYSYVNSIKIWIHKLNLFKSTITFSFSDEANYISENSRVFLKRKKGDYKINVWKKRKKDVLHYLSPDFSMNTFSVRLTFLELFKKNTFIIDDIEKDILIEIVSESIFFRLIKKIFNISKRG